MTREEQLDDIRKRSEAHWTIVNAPQFDSTTGHEKPWVVTTQLDRDVVFLLEEIRLLREEVDTFEEAAAMYLGVDTAEEDEDS